MSELIHGQVTFLLVTLCCGMALILCYEVLRLLRWLFKHPGIIIWIEDILYWSVAAVPVFYIFFIYNDGEIRWYGVLMLIIGAWLYEKGISRPIRRFLVKVFGNHKPSLVKWFKRKGKKINSKYDEGMSRKHKEEKINRKHEKANEKSGDSNKRNVKS